MQIEQKSKSILVQYSVLHTCTISDIIKPVKGTNENSSDTGRRWVKNIYKSWEGTAKCSKAHEIS